MIPSDAKRGFFLVIGILAGLYLGALVLGRLPQ